MAEHRSASAQPIVAGKVFINKRIWKCFYTLFQFTVSWMIWTWSWADLIRQF